MVDIDLGQPLIDIRLEQEYAFLRALVRLHGVPLGYADCAVDHGICRAKEQEGKALASCQNMIRRQLAGERLAILQQADISAKAINLPALTVAVCTRDRPADLRLCLASISSLDYPNFEVLVVDNAASDTTTRDLVRTRFPWVRYLAETRPGLSWARNRAIREAGGEVIAFTDDDVVVDQGWARGLGEVYAADPKVMAVTGLVVPDELATRAQYEFELYDGFGRGFTRRWHQIPTGRQANAAFFHGGTGGLGTGANMSFRRNVFDQIGFFDSALGAGTPSRGAEDLEMFFRLLKEGHMLVYEPRAIVRHRHRRHGAELAGQITDWGIASTAYLVRTGRMYRNELFAVIAQWFGRLLCRNFPRLIASFIRPKIYLRHLIWRELCGSFVGLGSYRRAVAANAEIIARFDGERFVAMPTSVPGGNRRSAPQRKMGQQVLELTQPITTLDLTDFQRVTLVVTLHGGVLGRMRLSNSHRPLSAMRIRDAVLDGFSDQLVAMVVGEKPLGAADCWPTHGEW